LRSAYCILQYTLQELECFMKTTPLTIRVEKTLKAEAKKAAEDDGRSLTGLIVMLLTDYLKQKGS
jgi:hypothetical protein